MSWKKDGKNNRANQEQADHPGIAAADQIAKAIRAISDEVGPEEQGASEGEKRESDQNKEAHSRD